MKVDSLGQVRGDGGPHTYIFLARRSIPEKGLSGFDLLFKGSH